MPRLCWILASTLPSLTACGNQPTKRETPPAVVEIVHERFVSPGIEFKPQCADPTSVAAALYSVGTLLDAWLVDTTALIDCARAGLRLWNYVSMPGGAPQPHP